MAETRENRAHPRYAVRLRSEIKSALVRFAGMAPESVVRNVSLGGAFIETAVPFRIGDLVPFTLHLPPDGREVTLFGRARWCRASDPAGVGVRFEHSPRLWDLISLIDTQIAPAHPAGASR